MPPIRDQRPAVPPWSVSAAATTQEGDRPAVLVSDPQPARRETVVRLAMRCGARFQLWDGPTGENTPSSAGAALALVGLQSPPCADWAPLPELKARGFSAIAYGDAVERWPLGRRASVLLAGAVDLLDSAVPGFLDELGIRLKNWLASEAAQGAEAQRLTREMQSLGLVGQSRAILGVFRWVARVAPLSDLPALLLGETGTGKELLARALHLLDPKRRAGPFVPVNCGAVASGIAESELFGHRRGAFSGADRDRPGLVRAAQGGVLFLDEIGDLDAALQGKLLRVLEERRVLGVGEERETVVDVRVVAATNRDLESMVRMRTFRADLFHRLDVLSVRVPPLREREGDTALLLRYFLDQHGVTDQPPRAVSAEFADALSRVALPGNVRQLANIIRRSLVANVGTGPLRLSDLPPDVWRELAVASRDLSAVTSLVSSSLDPVAVLEGASLDVALREYERCLVEDALRHAKGSRSRAARLLGITPRSVYNKIRKYGLKF